MTLSLQTFQQELDGLGHFFNGFLVGRNCRLVVLVLIAVDLVELRAGRTSLPVERQLSRVPLEVVLGYLHQLLVVAAPAVLVVFVAVDVEEVLQFEVLQSSDLHLDDFGEGLEQVERPSVLFKNTAYHRLLDAA